MSQSFKPWDLVCRISRVFLALLLALSPVAADAEFLAAGGSDIVRGFYATLLSTMKDATSLGVSGRYGRREPGGPPDVRHFVDGTLGCRAELGIAVGDPAPRAKRSVKPSKSASWPESVLL